MRLMAYLAVLFSFLTYHAVASAQSVQLTTVAAGFDRPVAIEAPADSSARLFVAEQQGLIKIVHGESVLATPFLDLRNRVSCCNERGLLGLAFHPDYPMNGRFYVNYTDNNGDTVVAEFRVSADANQADATSEQVLLNIEQPLGNHNGGHLAFGPDGYLYIGTGDGGGAGDPFDNAQDPLTLLGKMLRIDVNGDQPYSIPPDNPFAGTDFELDEIWATGLRNPFRYSFDRHTGDLYIADVGQDSIEEVNVHRAGSPAGQNYGWRRMEGSACFNPGNDCNDGSLTLPAFEYGHDAGRCSITGGYVYRGRSMQNLMGSYLFADFCSGEIFAASRSGTDWQQTVLLDTSLRITTFGQDEAGELFVADLDGNLRRLTAPLTIAPGSGTYLSSNTIDLSVIVRGQSEVSLTDLTATLNGGDISAALRSCAIEEALIEGGAGFTCPAVPLNILEPGRYTLTVELNNSGENPPTHSVVWEILDTVP